MPDIHEVATLTSKRQITLPQPIRQALGVDAGTGHEDPAIEAFLALLEQLEFTVSPDEDIDGDVVI